MQKVDRSYFSKGVSKSYYFLNWDNSRLIEIFHEPRGHYLKN